MKFLSVLNAIALTACAHVPQAAIPTTPKDTSVMIASAADTYRVPTLEDYPDLTPEEMGKRFLRLIHRLRTIDDLTNSEIEKELKISLFQWPDGMGGGFYHSSSTIRLVLWYFIS